MAYFIETTNDEATLAKRGAVRLGYWDDPYLKYFCKETRERKPPEINLGYYLRTRAFRECQLAFLRNFPAVQIVNLGCGFDTSFLHVLDSPEESLVKYVDVDQFAVVERKISTIVNNAELAKKVGADAAKSSGGNLICQKYCLVCHDLSDASPEKFSAVLKDLCGLDTDIPTLFLSECVLVYLPCHRSDLLLREIAQTFKRVGFLLYEQVNLDDAFGRQMLANLEVRGTPLIGADACQSEQSQKDRFTKAGYATVVLKTAMHAWNWLEMSEAKRIDAIEHLDEKELLYMLLEHYCFVWATNGLEGFTEVWP